MGRFAMLTLRQRLQHIGSKWNNAIMTRHLRLSVINRFATAKVRQKYETCKKSMCTNGGGKMLIINVLLYSMCTKCSIVAILKHIDRRRNRSLLLVFRHCHTEKSVVQCWCYSTQFVGDTLFECTDTGSGVI